MHMQAVRLKMDKGKASAALRREAATVIALWWRFLRFHPG